MNQSSTVWTVAAQSLVASRLTDAGWTSPEEAVDGLAAQGWTSVRIAEHAEELRQSGRRWPYPLQPDGVCGLAQAKAAQFELLGRLGLVAHMAGARHPRPLDADDRRLLAGRPPHHGSVG